MIPCHYVLASKTTSIALAAGQGVGSMSNAVEIDVSDKVLICGGGIGGLALGVALAKVRVWASGTL